MPRSAVTVRAVRALAACAMASSLLAAGTARAADPTGPRLKFDATELDLGDIVRGQDIVATFTYHNVGDAPLHILSAKPG